MSLASSSWDPGTFAGRGSCENPALGAPSAAAKRVYDVLLSAAGLLILSPVFLLIAALIKLAEGGPVLYRQPRVGLHGRTFLICKFRTMVPQAEAKGALVTRDCDSRVTAVGRWLRKTKLDELPQLWNVLKGEMSLVGPRPEVPRYVDAYSPQQRIILKFKPGITDLASLHFRNEELLLRHAQDVEELYLRHCVPRKLELNLKYAARATLFSDTWIILQTLCPYWTSLLLVYTVVLAASFGLSCLLVDDFRLLAPVDADFAGTLIACVAVQLGALIWRKQCKGLMSYFSLPELRQLVTALGFACLLLLGLCVLTHRSWPSRGLLLVDLLVSLCALGGVRLLLRHWRDRSASRGPELDRAPLRVGIIGAGDTGSQLARELMCRKRFGRSVVAFFDDDVQKWHKLLHNVPIIGMPECLAEGWAGKLDEVIIAMPEAPAYRIRELSRMLEHAGLRSYRAPSVDNLWC